MTTAIDLTLDAPDFRLEKSEDSRQFILHFSKDKCCACIALPAASLTAFLHQAQALLPAPQNELSTEQIAASWRSAALPLQRLNNAAWQVLLREVNADTLIYALWYLNSEEIAQRVMENCSLRAAAMLTDNLADRFQHGGNPDTVSPETAENGGTAIQEILKTLQRLVNEGHISKDYPA